jgi:hypothetical protein
MYYLIVELIRWFFLCVCVISPSSPSRYINLGMHAMAISQRYNKLSMFVLILWGGSLMRSKTQSLQ